MINNKLIQKPNTKKIKNMAQKIWPWMDSTKH